MTLQELAALCSLLMCSDPWPTSEREHKLMKDFADSESVKHGFKNWIEALHGIQ